MGLCGCQTEGACYDYPIAPKTGFYRFPHDRPGMKLALSHTGAISMRGANPNPTQNNRGSRAGVYILLLCLPRLKTTKWVLRLYPIRRR